jgi:hypothetical protein
MAQTIHQRVDQHESRYNPIGVHGFLLVNGLVLAPLIVTEGSMGVN